MHLQHLDCSCYNPEEALNFTIDSVLVSRFCNDPIAWQPKSHISYYIRAPFIFKERSVLIAKAVSDIDSGDSDNLESHEESLSVDNLTLESKLQLKLDR
ncbi:hypothetical protein R3W88_028393 [Solanum pinnatisectum]|uniref:Uncharacterized protein n=1 Tax=Solanum pinnatisectum TaxID=50273 RepID=A0AAV9LM18_9SOLN|nr:hypothetical protein R3W88_028393 [Solanum pinnatisectum]